MVGTVVSPSGTVLHFSRPKPTWHYVAARGGEAKNGSDGGVNNIFATRRIYHGKRGLDFIRWRFRLPLENPKPGTEPVRGLVEPFIRTWQFDPTDARRFPGLKVGAGYCVNANC